MTGAGGADYERFLFPPTLVSQHCIHVRAMCHGQTRRRRRNVAPSIRPAGPETSPACSAVHLGHPSGSQVWAASIALLIPLEAGWGDRTARHPRSTDIGSCQRATRTCQSATATSSQSCCCPGAPRPLDCRSSGRLPCRVAFHQSFRLHGPARSARSEIRAYKTISPDTEAPCFPVSLLRPCLMLPSLSTL